MTHQRSIEEIVEQFDKKGFVVAMKGARDFNVEQHNLYLKMLPDLLTSLLTSIVDAIQESKEELPVHPSMIHEITDMRLLDKCAQINDRNIGKTEAINIIKASLTSN